MDVPLQYRRRQVLDTEDAALHFVEEELGRFDAANNWKTIKDKGQAHQRIQDFLDRLSLGNSTQEIAEYLERFFIARPGRWR